MDIFRNVSCSSGRKFRSTFNGLFALIFVVLLFHTLFSKFLGNGVNGSSYVDVGRRIIQENRVNVARNPVLCSGIDEHKGYSSKCQYLRNNPQCNPGGFFDYINFFFCDCEKNRALGYVVLSLWLLALFYLLGNTAADYFCCCLEKLSSLLKLPPTVAGVTLLPLGNGAPDVFASIAAFTGRDSGGVGLNSVLGGAVFVTCVVVGTISLCIADRDIRVDRKCFIRDVCFFLAALLALVIILVAGEVSVVGAIVFLCIYVVYALCVAAKEIGRKYSRALKLADSNRENELMLAPLIDSEAVVPHLEAKLPHWMWASNVAIYSNEPLIDSSEGGEEILWGWIEKEKVNGRSVCSCSRVCYVLEFPLMLPRKLTIPIVDEERWSKVYAVASVTLAPTLLVFLLNNIDGTSHLAKEITYVGAALLGGILGVLAFLYTKADHPPQRFLFLWVVGGFVMSIIWFYIIASELVALLVSFGVIFGINPSLLAVTVLAWGNSMGDLMSNVAMAMNGKDGVQIAVSGCYAGPMFNTLAGLGISLLIGACSNRPASYIIPRDPTLYSTLVFLISGLLWSLFVLPYNGMRPNKVLGIGLMAVYVSFLTFRACVAVADVEQPLNG